MGMEVMRSSSSDLNPDAPVYVPWAYRAVEDFSKEWWDLVKSSPCFRDYWLREVYCQQQQQQKEEEEVEDMFEAFCQQQQKEEGGGGGGGELDERKWMKLEMMKWGMKEWRGRSGGISPPKNYLGKVPKKMVNVKRISPRVIQQPR